MRKGCLLFFLLLFSLAGYNQYVLTALNYSQDFNSLASTGTSAALPAGWYFLEAGVNANTTYSAGNGSSFTGDTYSFGSAASTERALGGLQSSNILPSFGFWMSNNTGNAINAIIVSYTGEQWRLGTAGRTDRLSFEYSLDATALDNGIWTALGALDFAAPISTGAPGPLDGNLPANRAPVATVINGLNIPVGATIFFRWNDFNATGADDGLSIDDLNLVITTAIPASTDHYRTIATGVWSNPLIWETSATGGDPWIAAIVPPTSAANTISIRNGHTVTIDANTSADQLTIQNGGNLIYSAGTFTVDDGIGDDVNIQNGGIFTLSLSGTPPTFSGLANVNVATGGILRVSAGSLTGAGTGVNSNNFVYQHQSILEYTLNGAFSTSNVTFFPNVNATTIPVFRTTANSPTVLLVGSNNPTIFNGIFECAGTATIQWQNSGNKIFRNGIRGVGTIDHEVASIGAAKFIINGSTAELGGTGSLIVPVTGGLEIGSVTGTTVTVTSDKTITGNVNLLSTNTYVDLGSNDLTISGTISGGSATSYVRTDANGGVLKLNSIGSTAKVFPIGETTYNPLEISTGSNADYSARVRTGIVDPNGAIPTDAVNRTWYIHASATTPGVTVKYQYSNNGGELTGAAATQPASMEILQSDFTTWHLSVGNTTIMSTPGPPYTVTSAVGLTINNTPVPYTLGVTGTIILSVDCIISCESKKMNNSGVISFNINSCAGVSSFEIQRSVNGSSFETIGIVSPDINRLLFSFTDASLQKGMNLYRIKVNRASGAIKYSNTTAIINDDKGVLISTVSPNPVHSQAVVTISTAKAGTINFSIYDITGRVIKQWQVPAAEGSNRVIMNLDGVQAGVYHLVASGEQAKTSYRFVKQ
ncbi:MAG: T9SS type A sorting domain-containing protein [Chitinophagaceae bacterium]|nr:T9SS type A sorting domain-containing protein [Chitinophagaceae bacterium]